MVATELVQPPHEEEGLKVIARVKSYPTLTNFFETAKDYYFKTKEVSAVAHVVGDKLEASFQGGLQWVIPKVEPVLQTDAYKRYAKPVLTTLDDQADKGLVVLESKVEKLKEVKGNLDERFESFKNSAYNLVEVTDGYLKESVVNKPIGVVLDATEKVVDTILPEDEPQVKRQPADEKDVKVQQGPVLRATSLSKKIKRQAFSKLSHLVLRPEEERKRLAYTVDLIQYAAVTLDHGVVALGGTLVDGVHGGAKYAYETPIKLSKEVKEKLSVVSQEAVNALNTAVQNISAHIPEPITTRVHNIQQALTDTAHHLQESESARFHHLAQKSSEVLRELSTTLGGYVSRGEEIPAKFLHTVAANITNVVESLKSFFYTDEEPLIPKITVPK